MTKALNDINVLWKIELTSDINVTETSNIFIDN